ncbi:hypothetical protein [Bifidobacterium myosotis]|uniref:Uncharacterized protein n=1 Tax=Bifidobacterium myosotis TaxID=1630166 RepID=A0A5M9ZG00_9BIFI|nr:hypothetical protein [Bifidobacterium myosotis]KAA8825366.1 hypothetical protein EMO91_12435 [Bifidobacterium myosotis]
MLWQHILLLVGGLAAAWLSYTLAVLYANAANLSAKSRGRFESFAWLVLYRLMVLFMLACLLAAGFGLVHTLLDVIRA